MYRGEGEREREREKERERERERERDIKCVMLFFIQEAIDRHARMQFTLQLSSNIQNPRKPVQLQQSRVR